MSVGTLAEALRARQGGLALPRVSMMPLLALIPAAIIVGLLGVILVVSMRESVTDSTFTLRHYASLYTNSFAYQSFLNTIGFSLVTLGISFLFGVPAAWLVERTDRPGKSFVFASMALGLLIPPFFTAMGWLFLLHPQIGVANQVAMGLLGLENAPISVLNVPGMGWVQGLGLASLVFVMVTPACGRWTPRWKSLRK